MAYYWKYKDARGVDCIGRFIKFNDFGGTDVTYYFQQDDGTLDLVNGPRLKEATRLWGYSGE